MTFKDGSTTLGTGTLSGSGNTRTATYATGSLAAGSHSITAVYAGDSTNATSTSSAVSQVVNQVSTTTALTSSANPAIQGQSITYTATVSGSSPSGTVTFKDGATTLGTGTLAGGGNSPTTAYTTSTLTTGSHSITAVYAGDTNNANSTSGALSQSITAGSSVTSLEASPNPASTSQSVVLSATVTGINPTGSVTFKDGGTTLGTGTLAGGVASFIASPFSAGSHSLTAVYSGDASNPSSTSSAVLLSVSTSGVGAMTWQYGYDAMGRLTTSVDPNGLTTYTFYDSLGRPIQTQQPPNTGSATPTTTSYAYNGADGLTQVTDPRNLATSYTPNGLGNVTSQASPDAGASSYTYDAKGNLKTATDARGKLTQYTYDSLDRLTQISYPTGTATTLEYDGGSSPTPAEKGELTKLTDESGQTSYTHDALGRLTSKTQTTGSKTFTVTYTWGDSGSALDKLTAITYPSGSRVNYSYDAKGFISAISVNPVNGSGSGTSGTSQALLSGVTYNADSNITGWSWSVGSQSLGYDGFGQLISYNLGNPSGAGNALGTKRTLQRDNAGRIQAYTHANGATPVGSLDQYFGYDNLNRMTTVSLAGAGTQYNYDANGNRTSKVVGATTYTNTIDAASNKVTQTQDVGGTATIGYDAAGHVTSDGQNTYAYSDRGRLASATTAGGTVSYKYNALELRVQKSGPTAVVPTGAAYYVYDEQGQLLGEYDANGVPVYETVYLNSLPVGALKQTGSAGSFVTTMYNVHADHLGAPRLITKQADQAIVWRWDTAEAYGGSAPSENPNSFGTFTYNQRFPGQVFDAETGLFQNWYRTYNPRAGRYLESDPIGLQGGINTYGYVSGSPLGFTDRMGLAGDDHVTGATKQCTKGCTIRIDWKLVNGVKVRHLHWECKGKSGVGGEFGGESHGDTLEGAPQHVKDCARKYGFEPDAPPAPAASCPPDRSLYDRLKDYLSPTPPLIYDPKTDSWVPVPSGPSNTTPVPWWYRLPIFL